MLYLFAFFQQTSEFRETAIPLFNRVVSFFLDSISVWPKFRAASVSKRKHGGVFFLRFTPIGKENKHLALLHILPPLGLATI